MTENDPAIRNSPHVSGKGEDERPVVLLVTPSVLLLGHFKVLVAHSIVVIGDPAGEGVLVRLDLPGVLFSLGLGETEASHETHRVRSVCRVVGGWW